jgi:hypothetical protein
MNVGLIASVFGARGPDVTGKAVAGMVFRNVLVVVSAALFLTLSQIFGW